MERKEQAAELFRRGFVCSQAVFAAYAEPLGLAAEDALRIGAPFGGGIGRMGHVCGAVTGACMVIGLAYGSADPGDRSARDRVYAMSQRLAETFEANHGTILCRELIRCDLRDPEQQEAARSSGLFDSVCTGLVRDAADILETLLAGEAGGKDS